jgi:hypothetical protein
MLDFSVLVAYEVAEGSNCEKVKAIFTKIANKQAHERC